MVGMIAKCRCRGWPLNVFLTPDLEPIFGGTYWPGPNTGTPQALGFMEVLEKIVQVYASQEELSLATMIADVS